MLIYIPHFWLDIVQSGPDNNYLHSTAVTIVCIKTDICEEVETKRYTALKKTTHI